MRYRKIIVMIVIIIMLISTAVYADVSGEIEKADYYMKLRYNNQATSLQVKDVIFDISDKEIRDIKFVELEELEATMIEEWRDEVLERKINDYNYAKRNWYKALLLMLVTIFIIVRSHIGLNRYEKLGRFDIRGVVSILMMLCIIFLFLLSIYLLFFIIMPLVAHRNLI